jgi:hypothetical protein
MWAWLLLASLVGYLADSLGVFAALIAAGLVVEVVLRITAFRKRPD